MIHFVRMFHVTAEVKLKMLLVLPQSRGVQISLGLFSKKIGRFAS